jgi:hypothetical protein
VKDVLIINPRDNVATALVDLAPGTTVRADGRQVVTAQRIASGHKVALVDIPAGEPVIKYGAPIGTTTRPILAGEHVHTHNLSSTRGRGDLGVTAEIDRETHS